MKFYLNILALLAASFVSTLALSCGGSQPEPEPVTLSANPSELKFEAKGGTISMTITSGIKPVVTCSDSWISLSEGSYASNSMSVSVKAAENTAAESRSTSIRVIGDKQSLMIPVTQSVAPVKMTADKSSVSFDRFGGESIDSLFFRGDGWNWQERLNCAELMLHRALSFANLPPEVSCAALLSDNVLFDLANGRVNTRWMLKPMEDMNPRETALLAADQVRKILPPSVKAGPEEQRFLDQLAGGEFPNVVALYGRWREARAAILAEREAFEEKNFIRRGLILLGRTIRRSVGRGGLG